MSYEYNDSYDLEELIDTLNNKISKIADLEAKLAEKNADLHQIYSHLGVEAYGEDIQEQALKEIRRLLEQISEKDKQLRAKIGNMKSTDFIKMCLECGFMIDAKEKDNQDKISFCIEQLEKLKNGIESKVENIYKRLDDLNIKIVCESTSMQLDTYEEIAKEIENQIEELKKEMK